MWQGMCWRTQGKLKPVSAEAVQREKGIGFLAERSTVLCAGHYSLPAPPWRWSSLALRSGHNGDFQIAEKSGSGAGFVKDSLYRSVAPMPGVETERDREPLRVCWSSRSFFYSHYSTHVKVIIVQVRPEN